MIGNKKVLAVVLARKGSKGIPGKNYRDLLGKPLFIWSMLAGMQSKYVDTTILSSNCDECMRLCSELLIRSKEREKSFGWIARPDELAGDLSKNEDALIHALDYFKSNKFGVVVNLQVTSPCRLESLVDRCIEEYYKGGYDSLLTATKTTPFLWRKKDGKWTYPVDYNDCCNRKMRQEFGEDEFLYHDCGSIFMTDVNVLLNTGCRIGKNPCVFEVEGINSLQIDTEFDFKLIENIAKAYNLKSLI